MSAVSWALLRVSSSEDLLCSTLDQKDLAVAPRRVVDQCLLSARHIHWSNARTTYVNVDPTRYHFYVSGTKVFCSCQRRDVLKINIRGYNISSIYALTTFYALKFSIALFNDLQATGFWILPLLAAKISGSLKN